MINLINIIRHRPTLSLAFGVVVLLITGGMVGLSGKCLKTKFAPRGIVSLELAWDQRVADTIRAEWQQAYCRGNVIQMKPNTKIPDPGSNVLVKAKRNIADDFYFLIGYPLFFVICIILCDPSRDRSMELSPFARWMVRFSIAAGVLDAIENIFMWQFLEAGDMPSLAFALPATVKFLLIGMLIAYLLVYLVRTSLIRIRG